MHCALRDPQRGRDGGARARLAAHRQQLGVELLLPEAVEILRAAGQTVEGENRVRFDPEFILEQVAKVPREFDLAARDPGAQRAYRWPRGGGRAHARALSRVLLPPAAVLDGELRPAGRGWAGATRPSGRASWRATLERYEQPPMDDGVRTALEEFVVRRRAELGD